MSFASTPLGQGKRVDRHTFFNKPHRRDNHLFQRAAPLSYSYAAPPLSRPPPQQPVPQHPERSNGVDETALVRFARLKEREQVEQSGVGVNAGPHSHISPHPEKWSVYDTSVNIAGAFNQAVSSTDGNPPPPMNPNETWASGSRRQTLPLSTSVEYEKETQSTINRRLAPPSLSRNGVQSASHMRQGVSEGEGGTSAQQNERGRSTFGQIVEMTQQPVAYLMRPRDPKFTARSNGNGNGYANESTSYDYSAEEREYQAAGATSQSQAPRQSNGAHRRNRISTDNKAYTPSMSEQEGSDEDDHDNEGKRPKKKKKKGGVTGGPPLTSLPTVGHDKKRRRRSGGNSTGLEEEREGESSGDEQDRGSQKHSQRGTPPQQRIPSASRGSVPPETSGFSVGRGSVPPQGDSTMFVERELLDEIDESVVLDSTDDVPHRATFSIGATLGTATNLIIRLAWTIIQLMFGVLGLMARPFGKAFGAVMDVFWHAPRRWIAGMTIGRLIKYGFMGYLLYTAYVILYRFADGNITVSWDPYPQPVHYTPALPAPDEVGVRLQQLESALAVLSANTERSRSAIDNSRSELLGRVNVLENQVSKERQRKWEEERKTRKTTSEALQAVKQELDVLREQLRLQEEMRGNAEPVFMPDEEARARVRALEERFGSVESGVEQALQLGKSAVKAGRSASTTGAWWNKLTSGKSGSQLVIKSSDGQDVSSLINHLVESSVSRLTKDTLARTDYALYSGGAQVIPSLTSETYQIENGWGSKIMGYFGGGVGGWIGRPPVTALHHDINHGHCWPFPGTHGQLGVKLAAPIYISAVTIDHVAKEVATDMRSTPRQMELWGLIEGEDNIEKVKEWRALRDAKREVARTEAELQGRPFADQTEPAYPSTLPKSPEYFRIASFTYNVHSPNNIQTFEIPDEIQDLGIDFGVVVLLIDNNWGRDDFTCLYRLRVHGERKDEVPPPYPEDCAGP
ncbi:uncharacterized protein LAESUDRAFT_764305 [Laetiporus sulphureus 93-53]|uniref:SUN domain-containing protein n=1 Tax=Laetiporus sulphureus 93-53 TaxID=1314785 RepID=A0A165BCZ2_9APHY|nr:uncharacterized protein LAESUDRAFT_764305 [Laetiporus sulphureus 93-53]KZT00772.1 hypothetical protein LAESUDRAFT_764305 [Laetiporus sulphureus 93-53]